MGFESISHLPDHAVDKSKVETSHVVGCNSAFVEKVETNLNEPFLLSPLENKEDTESMSTISDLANDRADGPEVISSRGDILELSISPKGSDDSLSLGCETPRECIFDPFAPGPGEAVCAPKKKVTRGAEVPPRRKLNFDSGDFPVKRLSFDWSDSEEEYQYQQVIQNLILDLCISDSPLDRQEETANIMADSSLCEGCMTPDSKPLLTGVASTSPDAPLRPSLECQNLAQAFVERLTLMQSVIQRKQLMSLPLLIDK